MADKEVAGVPPLVLFWVSYFDAMFSVNQGLDLSVLLDLTDDTLSLAAGPTGKERAAIYPSEKREMKCCIYFMRFVQRMSTKCTFLCVGEHSDYII